MAYITPSVLVYQQLEEAGGVLNTTPDLEAVIVGPLYNNVYVDPNDGATLDKSEAYTIDDWAQEAIDLGGTAFPIPLSSTTPGQVTDAASISVHGTDVSVIINDFDVLLTPAPNSLITGADSGTTVDFATTALPDATGNHANVGDRVIFTFDPGGGDETFESVITEVVSDVQLRLADPIPSYSGITANVVVYHQYVYKLIAATEYTLVNLGDEQVDLTFTASPFPGDVTYANYGFDSLVVHVGYQSIRQDTINTVLTVTEDDLESKLGVPDENNPLALAVEKALLNTTGYIKALATADNTAASHGDALNILEGEERAFYLTPLTQDESIITAYSIHCQQLSTPEEGLWRVVVANTELPEVLYLLGNEDAPVDGTTNGAILELTGTTIVLEDTTQTFLGIGAGAGDQVTILSSDDPDAIATFTIEEIIDNTRIEFNGDFSDIANGATAAEYYISRDLTKSQQADTIAARSEVWNTNRVWHIWPDSVGVDVDGITTYLPGYYLCAAHSGANSGFPVQQGLTNIALAGITDLQNSNFYFSRAQLGTMAEKGTCIYAQATQGGVPFCRHALTTDVSVLEYREQLKVKNWDFLSYYYKDKFKPFIGTWNITPDTLATMRQVAIASSELLLTQKLPKIGPPLLSYEIRQLIQDPVNKDQVIVEIKIEIVSPNNYTNVFLVI